MGSTNDQHEVKIILSNLCAYQDDYLVLFRRFGDYLLYDYICNSIEKNFVMY